MKILQIPDLEREELSTLLRTDSAHPIRLGTLGPEGTSSEYVARQMSRSINDRRCFRIVLKDTYERCMDALIEGDLELALVAHAYHNINAFYMNPGLEPAILFRGSTPEYGIATRRDFSFQEELLYTETVVAHPATIPLPQYYFPRPIKLVTATSTSQAASYVADGLYDIAITNEQATKQYGLKFVYRFARIPMTWTAFSRRKDCNDHANAKAALLSRS